ncbi:MAG: FprA family A-type flavoprotein [Candidatus Bathyarchaeia archaeon]
MDWRNVNRLTEGVYWVGSRDWNRRLFDALIPLPKGTSYNAYLVIGEDKKALIDTVNPGFEAELEEKIRRVTDPSGIDYLVMNHAEPDHAGATPSIMGLSGKSRLVATGKGVEMARIFYNVPEDRAMSVRDGDEIDLGGKTLRFVEAPMLHWPETMFTYLEEDGILFPCDFFGSHLAMGVYDDEVEDLLVDAQRYWGEIMMPFSGMARRALEKIKDLRINMIAPSHGPIYRDPQRILNAYGRWANGETKRKAVIVYVSMWKSTEKMVQVMADTLASEGVEVALYNLASSDVGDLAKDLVDSRAIVLGAPAVLGGAHPLAVYAAYLARALRPPFKYAAVLSSYGWGPVVSRHVQELLGSSKVEVVGALEVNGPPREGDLDRIVELGRALAGKIKSE